MKKVSNLIYHKGNTVTVIDASKTVFEALMIMSEKNIGALVVYDHDQFVGILTERDYAQKVIVKGKHSNDTLVSDIMESEYASVKFDDSIERCMEIMSERHIRYLPVIADNHVVGIVSMGDVVRYIIEDQKATISHLQNFISGGVM
ncbi:CBS domain-containing protein [Arcicella rigui]|uniref:CBS domain-containing protein n=1 Tax=Arcicella rigui TaxID=797020 RepID=A0ABU5Q4A7_9BACT|nr:CBS domain-containing protein [Arcicella rigui]MEA5137655.1 CBS domain-containing protein [Arcicella rigui]